MSHFNENVNKRGKSYFFGLMTSYGQTMREIFLNVVKN